MEGFFFRRFSHRFFGGVLIALLLFSPSFSQAPAEKSEPLTIQKIEVAKTTKGSRVMIEAAKPFEYSAFKLEKPLRVVVELPLAELGKLAGPIQVQDGLINVINNIQVKEPGKLGARVEIGLDQSVEYNLVSEGNFLHIEFDLPTVTPPVAKEEKVPAGEPPPKMARYLKDLDILADTEGVKVKFKSDGVIPDYKSFQIPKPTRLVVDLPGMLNVYSKRNIDVGSKFLKEIRIGRHANKLRLVFAFPGKEIPPFQLNKEGQSLIFRVGKTAEEELAPKKEETVVAETAKPVRVAAAEPKAEVKQPEAAPPIPVGKPAEKPKEPAADIRTPGEVKAAEEIKPVTEAKVAEAEKAPRTMYKGAKLSLDFKDADIHNIFRLIAEVSNLNIITTEDVKGKITIRLVNVPWDQALDVILTTKNLIKTEEGNVIRIATLESVRKEREEKQKEEKSLLDSQKIKVELEKPEKRIIKVNYADATELQKLLLEQKEGGKGFLSPQGSVKADKRTNTLIIQDVRSNLEGIEHLVKDLDSPTPQVLIEARVVQATTTFSRALGIQWGGGYNQTGGGQWSWGMSGHSPTTAAGWGFTPSATGAGVPLIMPSNFVVNFPASTEFTKVGGLGISFGKLTGNLVNLDLRLSLGETDGQTKIVARPKLATLDNKEAIIKQGEKIPYETTSQAGTQVQFIDAVLSLKVKPHVTPDGSILMDVVVTRDARGTFRSPINQVPSIDNREASTQVLVRDGETLVIGGIYESDNRETVEGIPWLMRIPILGWLFKSQNVRNERKELLIFVTPTIIQANPGS